ncbi:trimethylamine methyltransferase family protein [Halarsenatibacter silvermanii]|uniref:Trimethylamine---corrinoid protein Co-methyltransferase n=1 Tax=Halarsenatibacter silvermanii TaxID=321763 RepID=A0A1G9QN31_9FIRM|nr:trimethylamine methyltransferase family protein [Halarsenatibacter silvermanii]SDM12310.1 trimethylamine---corrinoid protein Co-methyltransferase [Halarsenatibacter silvermanii]
MNLKNDLVNHNALQKNLLSEQDLDFIHNQTVEILEQDGVKFDDKKALDIFRKNDIKTESNRVFLDEAAITRALKQIPEAFTLKARNTDNNVKVGGDKSILGPPLSAPFNLDRGKDKYSNYEDYLKFIKLYQQNSHIHLNGGEITPPTDIPEDSRHKDMFYAAVKYSDKPLLGTGTGNDVRDCLQMGKEVFGADNFAAGNYILKMVGASSPLTFDKTPLQTLLHWSQNRQPLAVYAQILAGVSGPATRTGLLIQQNAEILSGAVLVQLINSGTPVIYSSYSSAADMNSGSITVGNGFYAQIIAATAQIADYYNLPSLTAGALTDSNEFDSQSGAESMMNMMTAISAGVDIIMFAAGACQNYLGISSRKMIQDTEIIKSIKNIHREIESKEETSARQAISNVEPGDSFLTHPHTLSHLESEGNEGRMNQFANSQKEVEKMLANYRQPALASKIEEKLQAMIER